jgi:hypothetical protein
VADLEAEDIPVKKLIRNGSLDFDSSPDLETTRDSKDVVGLAGMAETEEGAGAEAEERTHVVGLGRNDIVHLEEEEVQEVGEDKGEAGNVAVVVCPKLDTLLEDMGEVVADTFVELTHDGTLEEAVVGLHTVDCSSFVDDSAVVCERYDQDDLFQDDLEAGCHKFLFLLHSKQAQSR